MGYTRALFGPLDMRREPGVPREAGLRDLVPVGVFFPLVAGVKGAGLAGPGLLEREPEGVLLPLWVGVVLLAEEDAVLRA